MKLNLGCGENKLKGFVNIDYYKSGADVECDLNKEELPFKDNSVSFITADCVLEHIKNLQKFISECYRVMKSGATIEIKTDYAGYLPLHIFKSHEHNTLLHNSYKLKDENDERIDKDTHCHLFVESHLKELFKEFNNIKITYPVTNHKWYNKILLKLLPYNLGKQHIQISAIKEEKA